MKKLTAGCISQRTDPVLKAILLNGIREWFAITPFDAGGLPHQYLPLIQDQQVIGWYHLFLARFSKRWSSLQAYYLTSHQIKIKGLSGDSWVQHISNIIITQWLELWDSRNADRHGRDSSHKQRCLHDQVLREITILYQHKTKVLQRDHSIFGTSLEEQSNKPTRYLRQWINTHQAVILQSVHMAKLHSLLNMRTLTSYFPAPP